MSIVQRFLVLSVAAAAALAAPAGAQRSALQPGVTVRVQRTGSTRQEEGPIVRLTADTLWLGRCGRGCLLTVPMRDLESADRYVRGRPSAKRRAAGVAVGFATASVAFALTGLTCWSSACSDAAFTVIAPIVTIGGGVLGYKLVTRRGAWQPVDLTREY